MPFPLKIFRVRGHSMEPTIRTGSFVLVNTWARTYSMGDIIAFTCDDKVYIKRVSKVSAGYEVRGDQTNDSQDSRDFGIIDKARIIGKAIWY